MTDTPELSAAVSSAAKAIGPNFTAYTERDGGPYYLIAGDREAWHGAERVADTDTGDRDLARAFLLFLMGQEVPGYSFARDNSRPLSWDYVGGRQGKRSTFTVWTDAACRVFETWAQMQGMEPRKGWPVADL